MVVLTDKYNLAKLVRVAVESKQWLRKVRLTWRVWPAGPFLTEWSFIAHVFRCKDDYDYLVNRLAVEVEVDETDVTFYYTTGVIKTKLDSILPDHILSESKVFSNWQY